MDYGFGYDMEQDYFHWLCELVNVDRTEDSYWLLARELHDRTFYSLIPHDENRALDGLELREEYLRNCNYPKYLDIKGECSVLEMLIGLARRMDFETSNPYDFEDTRDRTEYWFWQMLENLGLTRYSDGEYAFLKDEAMATVDWVIDNLLKRKYEPNGNGGLFPLEHFHENQCNVEIWYQMAAYLAEREVV